jgi:hypothetical protein
MNVKMRSKKKLLKQGKLNVAQNEKSNFKCFFFVEIASVKHFGIVHTVAVKQQTYYKVKKERKKQVSTLNKQFTLFSYREEQKSHSISKSRLQYSGFNTCSPIVIFLCYNEKPQHTKLT